VNSIGRFTFVPPDLLVGAPTADLPDIVESRCRLSNYCVVVLMDSAWSSGVGSDPTSEGMSSSDDSLEAEDRSSSSDIHGCLVS
jgi:hypothetical protein